MAFLKKFKQFLHSGRSPSWNFRNSIFQLPIKFVGSICVSVSNLVAIDQTVADIWPFWIFQDGGLPPSRIFTNSIFNC